MNCFGEPARFQAPQQRVQLTYDVEIADAVQEIEIPFVIGVLADLSGMPSELLPRLRDRKFVEIDLNNFDCVLQKFSPRVRMAVE